MLKKENRYCVIMAGGIGSRFWPASRRQLPKQFIDIMGTGKTFIRHTFERFEPIIPAENFLVVTNAAYKQLVLDNIPELKPEQVLCEPIGRNTAPCIAYAAFRLKAQNPDAVMVVAPSDHFIFDEATFRANIEECMEYTHDKDSLMTIGICPSRPDTGYGYIQTPADKDSTSKVMSFREKPDLETAMTYLASGDYFWNAGIFVWSNKSILSALENHLPELYARFDSDADRFATTQEDAAISGIFADCASISIDYGVLEKADNVYVRCCDFGWNDVGTWGSLYQLSDKDDNGNAVQELVKTYDSSNCIIRASKGKAVVVDSLHDYIVVDTPDALMICPLANEQHIKQVLDDVKDFENGRFV